MKQEVRQKERVTAREEGKGRDRVLSIQSIKSRYDMTWHHIMKHFIA